MSDDRSDGVRQFTVGSDDDGIRLDRWFKRHLPDTSFTTVAQMGAHRPAARRRRARDAGRPDRRRARCCACRRPSRAPRPAPSPKRERAPLTDDQIAFAQRAW